MIASVFLSLFLILTAVIVYLYLFFKKAHSYFNDTCFPTLKPTFIMGNLEDAILLRRSLGETVYRLHEKLKPHKFAGLYWLHRPFVMIRDVELVRDVLIRDFASFPDRGIHCNEEEEPLNNNLLRMGAAFAFLMMELALNPSIQDKVRKEIKLVLETSDGQVTPESLKKMTYRDMVIAEAMRKHPPAGLLFRECSKNYRIPGTEAIIPERTPIFISIYGLHMDSKYYEKPDEFYPEHFTEEAKGKRPKCGYMPFGEGPRICIGERLAKLEMKIGMINLIKDYSFEVSSKMKFPVKYNFDMNLGLLSAEKIWLQCRKI